MSKLSPDQELWAARIRLHFEPHLRDTAEKIARIFVPEIGARIKQLRPDTRMRELLRWFNERKAILKSSMDWVELMMSLEDTVHSEVSDAFAGRLEEYTFRELVLHLTTVRHVS